MLNVGKYTMDLMDKLVQEDQVFTKPSLKGRENPSRVGWYQNQQDLT